jgi:hypothetical protein
MTDCEMNEDDDNDLDTVDIESSVAVKEGQGRQLTNATGARLNRMRLNTDKVGLENLDTR